MTSNNLVALADVCEAIVDCEHKTAPIQPTGIPSIRTTDIKGGRLNLAGANRVSEETYIDWTRRMEPRPGDLILAREAPVGEVGIVPPGTRVCLGQRTVLIRPDSRRLLPHYLLYLLLTPAVQHAMASKSSGSTVAHLNMSDIRGLKIPQPPSLQEQERTVYLLAALDDKIELNRQLNHTLEAIARAIFKSWFVDFDPVRANMEGGPYPLDPDTLALFPDTFEDSELGDIPAGWSPCYVGDVVEIIKGRSYKSSELQPSNTALVTLKSIERGGGYKPEGLKSYTGDFRPEQEVKPGEIILAYTDLTQKAEVIGKPAIVLPSTQFEVLVASLDLAVVRAQARELSIPFLYELFMTPDFQAHVYGYTNGSTVLHLSKKGVPSYQFVRPSEAVLDAFTQLVGPVFEKIQLNHVEVRTLADLRDTLLPKLISGELRVPAAAEIVEEVAS